MTDEERARALRSFPEFCKLVDMPAPPFKFNEAQVRLMDQLVASEKRGIPPRLAIIKTRRSSYEAAHYTLLKINALRRLHGLKPI